MGSAVIRGQVKLPGSLASGAGDDLLTRDASTKSLGTVTGSITSLTDGYIFVGNASNVPTGVAVSGDIAITNTGVTSITTGVIVNADINASAAIALSKLAATTVSRAIVSDGSGVLTPSATTSTQIGYLSTTTSDVQTQIDSKQATVTGAATTITGSNLTANRAVISNSSGKIAISSVTETELGYVSGVTSAIQTQLNTKLQPTITSVAQGDILYYNGVGWVNLPRGTTGQTLQSTSTSIQWGTSTVNGLPSGGTANQVLAKTDGTDFNATWYTLDLTYIPSITASASEINTLQGVSGITSTELNFLSGASANIQTQLNSKQGTSLAANNIWVGNGSGVATATTDLPTGTTIGSAAIYRVGGTDVALADGGTGASLSDPGYDAVFVWDNTTNATRLAQLSSITYDSATNTLTSSGGGGGVTSVSGTSNRITSTGGTTPVIDIAATYVGQTSITTLGTIGTGTWQGTAVGVAYGGTGLSSYTTGDIIYASGATTLSKLAIGTAGQLLKVNAGATAVEYFTPTYISGNQTITLSGDITGSGTTAITTAIGANKVLDTMIRQSAGLSVIGRSANSTGDVTDITAASDNTILSRSGTSIGFNALTAAMVPDTVAWKVGGNAITGAGTLGSSADFNVTLQTANANLLLRSNGTDRITVESGGNIKLTGAVGTDGVITPTALAANTADYSPTGLSTATVIRASASTTVSVTGLAGGYSGRIINFQNVGANTITITNEDATSTAANRFAISANISIAANQGITFQYDSTSSRWRALGNTYFTSGFWNTSGTNTGGGGVFSFGTGEASRVVFRTNSTARGRLSASFAGWFFGSDTEPVSTVDIAGSFGIRIQTVTTTTTLDETRQTVLCDATSGAITINLPTATSAVRRVYTIKKIDSSINTVTIDGNGSETIDGATTVVLSTQYEYCTIHSDGSAWYITGQG